jgi:hypothetical protein
MRAVLGPLLFCVLGISSVIYAAPGQPPPAAARARGAGRVVVAKVAEVQPRFETNRHGDRLIVSELLLDVEETWKGAATPVLQATVEGGTIGALTLAVSDMPALKPGDRAVFFLDATERGGHVPHDRGFGILKLGAAGRIEGSDQTLGDLRRAVQAATR